jgi:Skp family chaperone for outer membrane proteins
MDLLGSTINATVVAAVGLALAWLGKGQIKAFGQRFDEVDRRFEAVDRRFEAVDRRFEAVDQRFDRLEERIERRIDALQTSIDAMRSDLTQVALALGVRPRATNG